MLHWVCGIEPHFDSQFQLTSDTHPENRRWWFKCLNPCHLHKITILNVSLLALACFKHLGSKTAHGRFLSFSISISSLFLSHLSFIIWKAGLGTKKERDTLVQFSAMARSICMTPTWVQNPKHLSHFLLLCLCTSTGSRTMSEAARTLVGAHTGVHTTLCAMVHAHSFYLSN